MKPLVAPTCATPASAPPAPRASSMPSSASRCGPACRSSSTAAGVGASPRGSRVNNVAPRRPSSSFTWRDTAGWVSDSADAAREIELCR